MTENKFIYAREIPRELVADELNEIQSPALIEAEDAQTPKKDNRRRVWLAIVYPESLKSDWIKMLDDACIKVAISPLHDSDHWTAADEEVNPEHVAGTIKKPHHHLVFVFRGPKSYDNVHDILKYISSCDPGSVPHPQLPYGDVEQAVQYLVHKNHPEKAQYRRSDIVSLNGFDADRYFVLTSEQRDQVCDALDLLIRSLDITDYWQIWSYLRSARYQTAMHYELWQYVNKHTILIKGLIDSRRFRLRDDAEQAAARDQHNLMRQRDAVLQVLHQAEREKVYAEIPLDYEMIKDKIKQIGVDQDV